MFRPGGEDRAPGVWVLSTGSTTSGIDVEAECFSQKPINYIQLVHNGVVIHELRGDNLPKNNRIQHSFKVRRSGWVALRAGHDTADPEDWWGYTQAAHTSPVYITVNGEKPANAEDARYLLARLDTTLNWAETQAIWSSPETQKTALDSFRKARRFFEAAHMRAESRNR